MAYNNGFPIGYQQQYYPTQFYPQYQQQLQQPTQPPQTQSANGMIWVQGIGGAKSYLVGPNATATLWDSEAPVIYLKSADASGMPTMKILDYTIRDNQLNEVSPITTHESFATKDDVDALRGEIDRFKARLDALLNKKDGRKEQRNE